MRACAAYVLAMLVFELTCSAIGTMKVGEVDNFSLSSYLWHVISHRQFKKILIACNIWILGGCYWRIKPTEMWCYIVEWVVADVLKDCCSFIFRVKQAKNSAWSWRWRHQIHTKCQELLVQWYRTTARRLGSSHSMCVDPPSQWKKMREHLAAVLKTVNLWTVLPYLKQLN